MKRLLLSTMFSLLLANAAQASHIAIYSDATGAGCNLAPGFSTTATILEKFSTGSTASRFKMDLSLCPGTAFFAFQTPFAAPTIGSLTSDLSVGYGVCLTGTIVIGNIVASWAPGAVSIVPADGQTIIQVADCNFTVYPATGGHTSISGDGHGCDVDAVQPSTWGGVKALYR